MKLTNLVLCVAAAAIGFASAAAVTNDHGPTEIDIHYLAERDEAGNLLEARYNPHCECTWGCSENGVGPILKRWCLGPWGIAKMKRDPDLASKFKVYEFGEAMPPLAQ